MARASRGKTERGSHMLLKLPKPDEGTIFVSVRFAINRFFVLRRGKDGTVEAQRPPGGNQVVGGLHLSKSIPQVS